MLGREMKQTQFIKLHVFHKNLGTDQTKEKRLTQAPHHTKYVLDGDLKKNLSCHVQLSPLKNPHNKTARK